MEIQQHAIIIIGAGPAGAACALSLSKSGYKVTVIEKDVFPRDKTCGDALSVDVINQLPMLSEELYSDFMAFPLKLSCRGAKIVSPDGSVLDLPNVTKSANKHGFLCKRIDFDNLLFNHMKLSPNIQIIQGCNVLGVEQSSDGVIVNTSQGVFKGKIVVGADGCKSVVARNLRKIKLERKHYIAGLRIYYEGITDFNKENQLEIFFFNKILPGYIWLFPLPNNQANVGIGILASKIVKERINLRATLSELIVSHPELKERFKNAIPLENMKGHSLPLGSKKRAISGERFLLAGDAAGLIDPISGEGVANSIRSGRIAAEHLKMCLEQDNYSAAFNLKYDNEIYRRMWKDLKLSRKLRFMLNYSFTLNLVVRKAQKNIHFVNFMIEALGKVETKNIIVDPRFYHKLLFSNKKG